MRILFFLFLTLSTLFCYEQMTPSSYVNTASMNNEEFEKEFDTTKEEDLFDPLSGYNKVMTHVNDNLYEYLLRPTAKGYAYVVPLPARKGISNMFENLFFPVRFINNVLQFKFYNSVEELERFVLNSTIGILGFMDVAHDEFGIKSHDEDFGQTLGHYGLGNGFHIVLPLLGPSNVRDIVGLYADSWANPINYIESRDLNIWDNEEEALYASVLNVINKTSLNIENIDTLRKDAIDLYPLMRSVYESRRNKLISE